MPLQRQYIRVNDRKEALPKFLKSQIDTIGGFVIILTGGSKHKMGTGKSWTAARIGELIDEDFSVDKICTTHDEFLAMQKKIKNSKKPYQVLIMDEAAVEASNKTWQSEANQLIGFSMDIMRDMRSIAIFITPQFFALDKTLRTLPAYWGYCIKAKEPGNKTVVLLYFRELDTDQLSGKTYYHNLRFHNNKTGKVEIAKAFKVNRISKELAAAYEAKSGGYKDEMRDSFYDRAVLNKIKTKGRNESLDYRRAAQEVYDNESVQKILGRRGKINETAIQMLQPTMPMMRAKALAKLVNFMHEEKKDGGQQTR